MKKIFSTIACFALGLVAVIGFKACVREIGLPDSIKDVRRELRSEDFDVRVRTDGDGIEEILEDIFEVSADDVEVVLFARSEDGEEMFLLAFCEGIKDAKALEEELISSVAHFSDLVGYTVHREGRSVYVGTISRMKDIID